MIDINNYDEYVNRKTPNSPMLKNCIRAFVVGGIICVIGEGLGDLFSYLGLGADNVKRLIPIVLVFSGALLTALGLYDKLGKFAGGGSIIPITGFANSIASAAIEFKKDERDIIGLSRKAP